MDKDKYPVISSEGHTAFEFLSEGPKGTIKKVVRYQKITSHFFNLAFGDWDEEKQEILDLVRSNNDDKDKILATVAFTIFEFAEYHPNTIVIVQGVTPSRTRLYQMGITRNWKEISVLFWVKGLIRGTWLDFELNKNYDAFLIGPREKT